MTGTHFWDFLDDETGDDLEYVRFTDADGLDDWGELYSYDYDDDRTYFDESDLDDGYFYYDSKDLFYDEDFTLDDLTFVADRDADGKVVELDFTAYGEDGDKAYGTVAIGHRRCGGNRRGRRGRRYPLLYGLQRPSADQRQRHRPGSLRRAYPGYTLQYVTFKDAPTYGSLYYNYYGTSSYGSSSSLRITDDNCDDIDFYFSPSSSQHALSELTYIPSGVNYCAQIPFTAYGSGSRSVSGTILISVNLSEVPDVYGPTPRNTPSPSPPPPSTRRWPSPAAWVWPASSCWNCPHQRGCHLRGQRHLQAGGHRDPVRLLQRQRADQPAAVRAGQRLHRICGNPLCGLQQQRRSHCQRQALPGHCQRYGGLL